MKFLVSKDIRSNPNFTFLLRFYALMLLLYFVGDLFYLADFFGSSAQDVRKTLLGDAETYIEPLSLLTLLEYLHISLFLGIFALFTSMAILLRLNLQFRHVQILISLTFGSLFLASLSLLGSHFLSPLFVYGFYYFTWIWHLGASYVLGLILHQLWIKKI